MSVETAYRWLGAILVGLLAPVLLAVVPTTPASAQISGGDAGPAMVSPTADRRKALTCTGDLDGSGRIPVLLVPGTGKSPMASWGPSYRPVLLRRGHPVCMVRLPAEGTGDVQVNVEYVATAIEKMAARAGRKISTIGVSQGALLPVAALRTWPQLSRHVEDVIGLAGVYDAGSKGLLKDCRRACLPALHQLASGSAFLTALHRRPLPKGPSYTNIGTRGDHTITPQPRANQLSGATSILVQDACPWHTVPEPQHAMLLGDAVALNLALDALDHDGAAASGRLSRGVCWQRTYPEFDLDALLSPPTHKVKYAAKTKREPALFCHSLRSCREPALRGRGIGAVRYTIGRNRITIRTDAKVPGGVRVVVDGRTIDKAAGPGEVVLQVPRPAGAVRLVVETRTQHYTAWAVEATKSIPGRRG